MTVDHFTILSCFALSIWRSNCITGIEGSRGIGYEKCREAERRKVNVLEMWCLRTFVRVSRMDRVRYEDMRIESWYRKGVGE